MPKPLIVMIRIAVFAFGLMAIDGLSGPAGFAEAIAFRLVGVVLMLTAVSMGAVICAAAVMADIPPK